MKKTLLFMCFALISAMSVAQTINTYPYLEDFEAEATCPTGCGAACGTLIDWTNDLTDSNLDWLVDVGGTSSSATGPSVDHTLGTAAGKYVYIETSCSGTGYPNFTANLESPWFNFTAYPQMNLSFWYHAFGDTQGPLNVEARVGTVGPGSTWTNVAGPIQDNVDLWQEWSGCLPGGVDSVQFRFVYVSGTSFTGDIGLDDISVAPVPPVEVGVTAIVGASGCGLSATNPVTVTVCNFGDTLIPGTVIPVAFSLDGATAVTENFTLPTGLASICNGGGCLDYTFTATVDLSTPGAYNIQAWTDDPTDPIASNDSSTIAANNIPFGGAIPYFENFEAGQGGWSIDNGTNGTFAFGTPAKIDIQGAASGDSCFVNGGLTGTYVANEVSSVTSPCIDISSANGAEVVTAKVWWSSENSWDGANLFASVDGGASWSQAGNFGDPNNWYTDNSINGAPQGSQEGWTGDGANGSNGWVCATHSLDSAMMVDNSSIMFRVGFGSDGSVQREGFAFDDFAVGYPITYSMVPDSILACDTMATVDFGAGYDWYSYSDNANGYNGTISGQTAMLSSANNNDVIIYASDSMGMCASDSLYLDVKDFVVPNLTDVTVCAGDSAVFDAGGDWTGGAVYDWSTGDTLQTSWLFAPGQINLTKTDTITGCMVMDSAMLFNLAVTLDDVTLCAGDTAVLDATSTSPDAMYMWNTGDSVSMITVNTAGTYGVTVTDTVIGCAVSDSMDLVVNALPVVDLGLDMTFCDTLTYTLDAGAGSSYLWSDASTNQTLAVSTTGTYSVIVTDANGCEGTDDATITFQDCSGLDELGNNISINLYPNPSSGSITVAIDAVASVADAKMTIVNVFGQNVRTIDVSEASTLIDLNDLVNGTYFIQVEMSGAVMVKRFVLNR